MRVESRKKINNRQVGHYCTPLFALHELHNLSPVTPRFTVLRYTDGERRLRSFCDSTAVRPGPACVVVVVGADGKYFTILRRAGRGSGRGALVVLRTSVDPFGCARSVARVAPATNDGEKPGGTHRRNAKPDQGEVQDNGAPGCRNVFDVRWEGGGLF